jgi:hypothetical protein
LRLSGAPAERFMALVDAAALPTGMTALHPAFAVA